MVQGGSSTGRKDDGAGSGRDDSGRGIDSRGRLDNDNWNGSTCWCGIGSYVARWLARNKEII